MKALSEKEIQERLEDLKGWHLEEGSLHTSIEFENFKEAFATMTLIAFEAERLQHHPDWSNVYNTLEIFLYTHDVEGITEKDFELAIAIDALVE